MPWIVPVEGLELGGQGISLSVAESDFRNHSRFREEEAALDRDGSGGETE